MSIELFLKAYEGYWDVVRKGDIDMSLMVPYEDYKISQPIGYIYGSMESEFTRELLNSINQFADKINSLSVWDQVISSYEEDQQFELKHEFVKLPMYYCLNQPRTIKDRVVFCSTHLCNQANLIASKSAKDDLPKEHYIGMKHLKEKLATWDSNDELILNIEALASDEYNIATKNYRNMSHHRIPANIKHGMTNFVTRLGYSEDTFEHVTIEDGKEVNKSGSTRKHVG